MKPEALPSDFRTRHASPLERPVLQSRAWTVGKRTFRAVETTTTQNGVVTASAIHLLSVSGDRSDSLGKVTFTTPAARAGGLAALRELLAAL